VRRRGIRLAFAAISTATLLQSPPCSVRAQRALIGGFFEGFTPWLIDHAAAELDLTTGSTQP
jgi:hypothetical protein